MSPAPVVAQLRAASLRVTRPRVAVLRAVREHPHADVDLITRLARERLGRVSKQAVYDVLQALVECGLVRRIDLGRSPARFDPRVGDNHHHLACRSCGSVVDVDCAIGAPPCLEPADRHGFSLDEAQVTFWGLCGPCQRSSATSGGPPDENGGGTP